MYTPYSADSARFGDQVTDGPIAVPAYLVLVLLYPVSPLVSQTAPDST